ncbi:MAG: dockerin type I domain-containing protein [Candidatus Binatia bacterium]
MIGAIAWVIPVLLVATASSPRPVRADAVVGTGTLASTATPTPTPTGATATVTRPPTRTPTTTWTPNLTPTWTPIMGGDYLCRGGNRQGNKCGYDAECPGGICTRMGHARACANDMHCVLSHAPCRSNLDCQPPAGTWPAQADYCPYTAAYNRLRTCTADADCGVCEGGTYEGFACTADGDCPSSTCTKHAGTCINGVGQGQFDMWPQGPGAAADEFPDWSEGAASIEDDLSNQMTAASLGSPRSVSLDRSGNRLYVGDDGTNAVRVSVWNTRLPSTFAAADAFLGAPDSAHGLWNGIPGDLTITFSGGTTAANVLNANNGVSFKVARDPLSYFAWQTDGPRILKRNADAATNEPAVMVLGHKDFAGTVADSTDGRGLFAGLAIAQRCVGGSTVGKACTVDGDCSGGGTCKVSMAAGDWLGAVPYTAGRVMVWTDLEAVGDGQAADIILPISGRPIAVAFDTNGDLYVLNQTNNQVEIYAAAFNGSSPPYARLGGYGSVSATTLSLGSWYELAAGLSVDLSGDVFVADIFNNRVVEYPGPLPHADGQAATGVVGQSNLTSGDLGLSSNGALCDQLYWPQDVAADDDGGFWVADTMNNRALHWQAAFTNGGSADRYLGQADCNTRHYHQTSGHSYGRQNTGGIAFYPNGAATGKIACDSQNHRCLVSNDWTVQRANGQADNDAVLGQADFTSFKANRGGAATNATLNAPSGVTVSTTAAYIADTGNNRVQEYTLGSSPNRLTTGQTASASFGGGSSPSATSCLHPTGVKMDPDGNLWAVCQDEGRVVVACLNASSWCSTGVGDTTWDHVLGKATLTTGIGSDCASPTQSSFCKPFDVDFLTYGSTTTILVSDTSGAGRNGRVLLYSYPPTSDGPLATGVLGVRQGLFTAYDAGGQSSPGVSCSRTTDAYLEGATPDGLYCDWSVAPWVNPPRFMAVSNTSGVVWIGRGNGAVEYRAPLSTASKATRVAGAKWLYAYTNGGSGYTGDQWCTAYDGTGLAFAPNGDLLVMLGCDTEAQAGIYGLLNPNPTLTPTGPTVTAAPTATPTGTIPTQTPTATRTPPTATPTDTPTVAPAQTPTAVPIPTATSTSTQTVSPTSTPRPCAGDCNGNGTVTVNDILTLVNIALGNASITTCEAGDVNHDGRVTVDEILAAVNNALNGCRTM